MTRPYEKLGSFYLGRLYDDAANAVTDTACLYDSKDLTTHAVCVGMTGSGKTGLCVGLLEEAALDGIPAIVIDPKGDLGNLLLTFPDFGATDFLPWVNGDEAARKNLSTAEFAAQQAELWKTGLAKWDQDADRVRRLKAAAEFTIYTPGSNAGVPVSILSSFATPPAEVVSDGDLMRERVATTATSLLTLMGIEADPIQSREHILVSTILDQVWRQGRDLDLGGLIHLLQSPPVDRIGVLELESFYPAKERFKLAMQVNNLLAAPGFSVWLDGPDLDVGQLLYTAQGRPRVAIMHIAHLSEPERMFFVSLLLNQVIGWMRSQPGTTSLRALLYMDEVFGFMPPTAEPPSKRPLLTLLKQARAYGLGVVLSTQNPVDLDYKGLSNTGTWLLGRLQTERDKLRVLDGLEGASGGAPFDRQEMERTLSGLDKRVFLMHNVHEREPALFHTRWVMSYLCGPLTRDQIKQLKPEVPTTAPRPAPVTAAPARGATSTKSSRPALSPGVPQAFLPLRRRGDGELQYRPYLVGLGSVQFIDKKTKRTKHVDEVALALALDERSVVDWQDAAEADLVREDLDSEPDGDAGYAAVPKEAGKATSYRSWKKQFSDHLYSNRALELWRSPELGLISEPGEDEGAFRVRLTDQARQQRDKQSSKLRQKYARRVARLEDRIRRAMQKVEREKEQVGHQRVQNAISFGATVLSAFLGRKSVSRSSVGRATTTMRGMGRTSKEKRDVDRARRDAEALQAQLDELNRELEQELDALEDRFDAVAEELEVTALRPRRSDVRVETVTLAWAPFDGSDALWS